MRQGFIYTLSEPDNEIVRYVGQTIDVKKRFNLHIFHSKNDKARTHKEKWINTLTNKGLKPLIDVVWSGDISDLDKKEEQFILLFKSMGAKLTNATSGGTTTRGRKCSEETKQKLSKMFKGRPAPYEVNDEWKRKCRESGRVMIHTPESKAKLREAKLGKPSHWTFNLMPENARQRIKALGILSAKKIWAIKDGVETLYDSTKDAERATGCDRKTMRMVANGIYKQCKGYTFKFV